MTRLLLTPDEARAVRDGRKTQHRMPVEPQPEFDGEYWSWGKELSGVTLEQMVSKYGMLYGERPPLGQPGDVVEVVCPTCGYGHEDVYRHRDHALCGDVGPTTATITAVRAERLWDISNEDAIAEGFHVGGVIKSEEFGFTRPQQVYLFAQHWNARHPDHPWASNLWVFVYEWEVTE